MLELLNQKIMVTISHGVRQISNLMIVPWSIIHFVLMEMRALASNLEILRVLSMMWQLFVGEKTGKCRQKAK